jgi:hypothetical protein
MTVVLPNGYVTLLEAAETLLPAMYAGVPDLPVVKSLRQKGIDVRDGPAMDQAVGELWKAVDEGGLRPMAIGGRPRRIERLDAAMTKQIPTLRHARGRGFTFLRQSNPAYHQPASCFGSDFPRATLAFRETEVHNLARKLIRTRRATLRADGRKARGRPSRQAVIISTVLELVERGKFVPLNGLKALTQVVKRAQRDCRHVRRKRRKIFNAKCGEASGNSCGDCDRIIFGLLVAECTENLIHIDYVRESPNVSGDDWSALLVPDLVRLAVQVEQSTCGRERGAPTSADRAAAEGARSRPAHEW